MEQELRVSSRVCIANPKFEPTSEPRSLADICGKGPVPTIQAFQALSLEHLHLNPRPGSHVDRGGISVALHALKGYARPQAISTPR